MTVKNLKYKAQHQEPLLPFILSLTHRYFYIHTNVHYIKANCAGGRYAMM